MGKHTGGETIMDKKNENVVEMGKTQDAVVYNRIMKAICESAEGMTKSQVVGVLEAVKYNLFFQSK